MARIPGALEEHASQVRTWALEQIREIEELRDTDLRRVEDALACVEGGGRRWDTSPSGRGTVCCRSVPPGRSPVEIPEPLQRSDHLPSTPHLADPRERRRTSVFNRLGSVGLNRLHRRESAGGSTDSPVRQRCANGGAASRRRSEPPDCPRPGSRTEGPRPLPLRPRPTGGSGLPTGAGQRRPTCE